MAAGLQVGCNYGYQWSARKGAAPGDSNTSLPEQAVTCTTRESHMVHCLRITILKGSITPNKGEVKSTLIPTYGLLKSKNSQ